MNRVKKYIAALGVMWMVSIVSLVIVGLLTYLFKWQADKAMIGIILTYVLAGFVGGFFMGGKRTILGASVLGTIYVFLSVILAYMVFQISFKFTTSFLLICTIIVCSCFVGMCLKR